MIDISALKELSLETKAQIFIMEFQARRMPMFQMREVLGFVAVNDNEMKLIAQIIESNLAARGYPAEQVMAFLGDLRLEPPAKSESVPNKMEHTRRVRPAFTQGFEGTPAKKSDPNLAAQQNPPPDLSAAAARNPIQPPASGSPKASISGERRATTSGDRRATTSGERRAIGSGEHSATFMFEPVRSSTTVGIPRAPIPRPPVAAPTNLDDAHLVPPPADGRPVIVLAEDDKRARMVFKIRLEEAGFCVMECGNGRDAWLRIEAGGISGVVLDMKMPEMHGLEVMAAMTQRKMTIPVVICSAYDQLDNEAVVHGYPKLRYLVKPIAPESVVNALKEMLSQKPVS